MHCQPVFALISNLAQFLLRMDSLYTKDANEQPLLHSVTSSVFIWVSGGRARVRALV